MIKLSADYRTFSSTKKRDILKPTQLKTKVENDLQLSQYSLCKDWKRFYKYVVEKAVAFKGIHFRFVQINLRQEESR